MAMCIPITLPNGSECAPCLFRNVLISDLRLRPKKLFPKIEDINRPRILIVKPSNPGIKRRLQDVNYMASTIMPNFSLLVGSLLLLPQFCQLKCFDKPKFE